MDEVSDFTDVVRNIMKRLGPDAPLSKILWECCREVMADLELKRSPSLTESQGRVVRARVGIGSEG
jgi:hypothetical protein